MNGKRKATTHGVVEALSPPSPTARVNPWWVLAALAAVAAGMLGWMGVFAPVVVNDTKGYAEFDFSSLNSALSQQRTPGYPALLALIHRLTGSYGALPAIHFALFCGGIALFHAGLLRQGFSQASSPWIAGAIFSAYILGRYVSTLATDTTAAALGVATGGALLIWTAPGERRWLWGAALGPLVTIGWLVRPVMLFLVPLVCVAAPLFELRTRGSAATWAGLARFALVSAAIVILPLVAWCGLRWQAVGKFGVVSFGGYNLIGITGQFLDEALVAELPEHLRPLVQSALQRRQSLPPGEIPLPDDPLLRYSRMEVNYDVTIWKVFVPASQELYGNDAVQVNSRLRELGVAIARLRPEWYGVWLAKACRQALRISCQELVGNPVTGPLIVLTIGLELLRIVRCWRRSIPAGLLSSATDLVPVLLLMSVLYAASNLLLVIVVCPPLGRMTDAATVLFPALIAAVFCDRLSLLRQPLPVSRA